MYASAQLQSMGHACLPIFELLCGHGLADPQHDIVCNM